MAKLKLSISELVGWYGTIAIIVAFALLNVNIIKPSGFGYQFLNISGAGGLAYISFRKKAYQPGVLNLIWLLITIITMF